MCLCPVSLAEHDSFNKELDEEMLLLLELHKNFCGEYLFCKNDSSHREPSEEIMPVPCCVPCSCLPTCGDQMVCCPAFWKNKSVDDRRLGVRGTPNEQMTNQSDITHDVIARAEDNLDETVGNRGSNDLSSTTNCIRPQALYKPIMFLDSQAYGMVNTCPEWLKDVKIIEKCHAGINNDNILDIIPVTSTLTGMTYANIFCADCNGISANATSQFRDWQPSLVGLGVYLPHRKFILPDLIIEEMNGYKAGRENIHFITEKALFPVPCNTYDIQVIEKQ